MATIKPLNHSSPQLLRPPSIEDQPSEVAARPGQPSARDLLASEEITEKMRLSKETMSLDAADQVEILNLCNLDREGYFPWSLKTFLYYLASYFSSKTIEGTVEMTQGTFYAVGKSFWQKMAEKKEINPTLVTPEMWNFCTAGPRCYEFWIQLPASFKAEFHDEQIKRFQTLVAYFFAVQALPDLPKDYVTALREFQALMEPHPSANEMQEERLAQLRVILKNLNPPCSVMETLNERIADIEIFCSAQTSLKVSFSFSSPPSPVFRRDNLRLGISAHGEKGLSFKLICPANPWECLHDQLIHRLALSTPKSDFGLYFAHLTHGGAALESSELAKLTTSNTFPAASLNAGIRYLPLGDEALFVNHFNAISFLKIDPGLLPTLSQKAPNFSPMGSFLFSQQGIPIPYLLQLLQVIGNLQMSPGPPLPNAPCCRRSRSHLEIFWETSRKSEAFLFLVLDDDFEKALNQVAIWLKKDPKQCLRCISQALKIFFPALPDRTLRTESAHDSRLLQIYQALRSDQEFFETAVLFYFLLHRIGWKTLDASDILDLPNLIRFANEKNQLPFMFKNLNAIYQATPYAALLQSICQQISSLQDPDPEACRQICIDQLLLSKEILALSPVWTQFKNEVQLPFLLRIAPTLDADILPYALTRVCNDCRSLSPVDCLQLVCLYFERLITQRGLLFDAYQPQLIEVLKDVLRKNPELAAQLISYPAVYKELTAQSSDIGLQLSLFIHGNRCDESDVLRLADFIAYGAESEKLDATLESLEKIYRGSQFADLYAGVKNKIAELESPTPAACRQACLKQLLVCSDPRILARAWALTQEVEHLDLLLEIAPALNPAALPYALECVLHFIGSLPLSSGRIQLLCVYLNQLFSSESNASYRTQLIDSLNGSLKENPSLQIHLSTYPNVIGVIHISESSLITEFQRAINQLPITVWWGQFLTLQKKFGSAMDRVFQEVFQARPLELSSQEGFEEVFNSLAKQLFDKQDETALISLITSLPDNKAGKLRAVWLRALIERHLQQKNNVGQWLATLKLMFKNHAYQQMDRAFLTTLFSYLTDQKNVEMVSEIHALYSHLQLKPSASLLDYFIVYYSSNLPDAGMVVELKKSLPYFAAAKDERSFPAIHALIDRLQTVSRNQPIWGSFAELLGFMERTDFFLDSAIRVLETLASDPPLQCFRMRIDGIGKRLTKDQKIRLASAYATAVGQIKSEETREEILKNLPDAYWAQEFLRNEETWEGFTRLFLHSVRVIPKDQRVFAHALWAAPRLLAHPNSSFFPEFEKFLIRVQIQSLDTAEWRPFLGRFIDRNPELLTQVDKAKRQLFEKCRTKKVETPPVAVPVPIDRDLVRKTIREILSKPPVSFKRLAYVTEQFKHLPGEVELWQEFFKIWPEVPPLNEQKAYLELLKTGWDVWIKTHPLQEFLPENSQVWSEAIDHFLNRTMETSDLWPPFIIGHIFELLTKINKEHCQKLTRFCLDMGTLCCWKKHQDQAVEVVRVLHQILASPNIQEKLENPGQLLEFEKQIRLFLLMAHHPDAAIQKSGEEWFVTCIQEIRTKQQMNTANNLTLFKIFACKPFAPRVLVEYNKTFLGWIEESWPLLKDKLNWGEACGLIKKICLIRFEKTDELPPVYHLRIFQQMLQDLDDNIAILHSNNFVVDKNKNMYMVTDHVDYELFPETTLLLMDRIMQESLSPNEKVELLRSLRKIFSKRSPFTTTEIRRRLLLANSNHIWSLMPINSPEMNTAAEEALDDLDACLVDFPRETKERQHCIQMLSSAIPHLCNVDGVDLIPKIGMIFNKLMDIPWIVLAGVDDKFSWFNLLFSLTDSIRSAPPKKQHAVAQTARQIFINCTHRSVAKKRNGPIPLKDLLGRSTTSLGFTFMARTEPECLTSEEWKTLIQGLAEETLIKMVKDLSESQKEKKGITFCFYGMGIARLIRFTTSIDPWLIDRCLQVSRLQISAGEEAPDKALQLKNLTQWILAISDLSIRCQVAPKNLNKQKNDLVVEFASRALLYVQDDENHALVSRMIFELETANAVPRGFQIPPESSGIDEKVQILKTYLENIVTSLKKH